MIGDLVRTSCKTVVDQAKLVQIDHDRLGMLASLLVEDLDPTPKSSLWVNPTSAINGTPFTEATVGRVLALDAINFGSGYHDVVDKEPGLSGAKTMATRLGRWIDSIEVSPAHLVSISDEQSCTLFGQDPNHPEQRELTDRFAQGLRALGRLVINNYDQSFINLVEAAETSAQALAQSLRVMAFYDDRATTGNGHEVHFHKRAQITAADLARQFGPNGPTDFVDLADLTAFADNLVPHVLRVDQALKYDPALSNDIDAGRRLESGSSAEIEIRASGVVAVEHLVDLMNSRLDRPEPVRAMDVDEILWLRGGAAGYKAIPRHRARSVYY